jgi:4a-hydroxytetrahydrobiopterin dehydratase|tara:strand:+ start:2543 stop:2902 length:360 start_codon:yes stop_codon:yes gene_type:complete
MKLKNLMKEYYDKECHNQILAEQDFPVNVKPGMDWEITGSPNRLIKKFKFKKRKNLYNFLEDVLELEDEKQHHSEITVRYKTVTIKVWTHDLNDITEVDIEFARTVNEIYKDSNESLNE